MSIAEIVREGLEIHDPDTTEAHEQRVIRALQDVGLDPTPVTATPMSFPAVSASGLP